jgi:hypothetical protein
MLNSKIFIHTLPTLQISVGVITLFEKIYDETDSYRLLKYRGECTIPLFQSSALCEKCVAARHYSMALLGNNYLFQMIDTRFAKKF